MKEVELSIPDIADRINGIISNALRDMNRSEVNMERYRSRVIGMIKNTCEAYHQSKLQALKEEVEPLKRLLDTIQTSRKGSMGSIDNVYLPQLSVKSVREARESLNLITNLEDK